MLSRTNEWRRRSELACRLVAIALLGWALWLAIRPVPEVAHRALVDANELPEALRGWAVGSAPESVHVRIDSLPDAAWRDWLVALRRAGSAVGWSGALAPLAIAIEPVNAPAGGARLLIAGEAGDSVAVRDAIGPLDDVHLAGSGGVVRVPALAEPAEAALGSVRARAVPADSLAPGTVLVLATAGWEARYAIAALEESGWRVDARLTIGPGLAVRRGTPGAVDTARYAVVIALDSAAAGESRRLASFARMGGGLVLSGIAAALPGLREIAPGQPGARVRPAVMAFTAEEPRRALGFLPVARPRLDAVVLETRAGAATVAARREGTGRVVQVGYDESWRWRMQGGARGMEAHQQWWSSLVAGVALRRATPREVPGLSIAAAAPRVAVVAALGRAVPRLEATTGAPRVTGPHWWMLVASVLLLLLEWTSRRLRGAP